VTVAQARSIKSYRMFAVLAAATLTVLGLGWIVAGDFRKSAEGANQLYDRFGEGLDLIDNMLFETGEVRRILLYALHTSDANLQLDYVDQSRSAEGRVKRLLDSRPPILLTERTQAARESVAAAWTEYLETRDEVVGLILEGSLREAVDLDEALGTARFNRVRNAIADLKTSFKADAATQVEAERARSGRAIGRLVLIGVSALLLMMIGVYLVNRRASLEVVLRIKTDFLTTMSHELRTPLTGVIGITDLLQTARIPPDQRELVRMLRTNATTLLGLVNNVLDYSRIEAGLMALAPRRFAIQAAVEQALDSVSEIAARKGLALGYVIAPGVPDVIADEERVRQVILNLLSNAVKYTETGQIAIHVDATIERDDVVVVAIKVRDTGVGIREELQQRLFQWFSQIEPAGGRRVGGTGLGLAISDRLSRLLGGSMAVESRPAEGSTFTFVFRGTAAGAAASSTIDAADVRGARVLIVFGPGIVSDQVQSLLRTWNVHILEHDGHRVHAGDVDAVILDADAADGALAESFVDHRADWGLQDLPLITIAQLRPARKRAPTPTEHVVTAPVRMQALYDALCAAIGRASPGGEHAAALTLALDKRLDVLLVEDNESNRRVVALMLAELGLEADEAGGGHEAVEQAARRHYDIILMDVQMPDLDGLEATRRIRAHEQGHRATIVALTANVLESDEARCRAAGMDGYLQKPLSLDTLSAALNTVAASAP